MGRALPQGGFEPHQGMVKGLRAVNVLTSRVATILLPFSLVVVSHCFAGLKDRLLDLKLHLMHLRFAVRFAPALWFHVFLPLC